jgi:hypothetical protein
MRALVLLAIVLPLVVAAVGALSCSSQASAPADDCSSLAPPSCPSPPPSWTRDVRPIIDTYCLQCHGEGGIEVAMFDYTTYQGVSQHVSQMVTPIFQCTMPPLDASPLPAMPTDADRETILAWIACGAPDN